MRVVADSHALYWFALDLPGLSDRANEVLEAAQDEGEILVSTATLIDLWLVTQTTHGIVPEELDALESVLADPAVPVVTVPVTTAVFTGFKSIPYRAHRDPWDRLIVATALAEGVPLVTRDRAIQRLGLVETIW